MARQGSGPTTRSSGSLHSQEGSSSMLTSLKRAVGQGKRKEDDAKVWFLSDWFNALPIACLTRHRPVSGWFCKSF